jgi:hypothetical protein
MSRFWARSLSATDTVRIAELQGSLGNSSYSAALETAALHDPGVELYPA